MTVKIYLFAFIVLLVSGHVLHSYYNFLCVSPKGFQASDSVLDVPAIQDSPLGSSNFTLIIKVLAFDRLESLSRCLRSLSSADYDGHRVDLHVYVDHFVLIDQEMGKNGKSAEYLERASKILNFLNSFHWNFGDKMVHYRTHNAGLQGQWLEAWWPSSTDEFAFIVEDDLELSPLYFKFIRDIILNYYYTPSNFSPYIYGVSLQRPRFVPGKHGKKMNLDNEKTLFLYQLVGTWGQLLFPKPWKEFRLWYDSRKSRGIKPYLEGMVTNGWYKRKRERIWTPWFVKFVHSRGYFNIYTNLPDRKALSVSHRDAGVSYASSAGPDSQLLGSLSDADLHRAALHPLRTLNWYDFCFDKVRIGRAVRASELDAVLRSRQRRNTVILISIPSRAEGAALVKNALCHLEKLGLHNYVLVSGARSELSTELAGRGHPVVVDYAPPHLIGRCLGLGYSSLFATANSAVLLADFATDLTSSGPDFSVVGEADVLFVRSSPSSRDVWDRSTDAVPPWGSPAGFAGTVRAYLSRAGVAFDVNRRIATYELDSAVTRNGTLFPNTPALIFWKPDATSASVKKKLEELGLWVVDEDVSCLSVVCRGVTATHSNK